MRAGSCGVETVKKRGSLFIAVIAFIVLVTYFGSIRNGFVYDDWDFVVGTERYEKSRPLLYPFIGGLRWGAYRPLRDVSHAIDRIIWKDDPMGHHISSILIHVVAAVVIFQIGLLIFGEAVPALVAAIFFGIHPIQTESVSWVSGRRDILCGLFYLTGLLMFIRYHLSGKRYYIVGVIFSYILSLSSKEMGVSLPLVLVLYDYLFMGHSRREFRVRMKYVYIPLLILAIAFSMLTLEVSTGQKKEVFHGESRYLTSLGMSKVVAEYMKLLVVPAGLCAEYDVLIPKTVKEPMVLVSIFIVVLVMMAGVVSLRMSARGQAGGRRGASRIISFGILWFFVTLLPVSNVIVPVGNMMAERYLYIPSAGVCILLGLLVSRIKIKRLAIALVLLIAISYSYLTITRNKDWKDDLTFWSRTASQVPTSARAHYSAGKAYADSGMFDMALMHLRKAVAIAPDRAECYSTLGYAYLKMRLFEEAEECFKVAVSLDELFATGYLNLGVVYEFQGKSEEAIAELKKAVVLEPDESLFHYTLAAVYGKEGELEKALYHYEEAVRLDPADLKALNNLGDVYMRMGNFRKAELAWRRALEIEPDFESAIKNLQILEDRMDRGE